MTLKGYVDMKYDNIQQLFDKYEDLSIEVEQAKRVVDASQLPDLSKTDSISAAEADEYLIAHIELERKEQHLESVSQEWAEIQELLVEKLCKVNTRVRVIDRRDGDELLISCLAGSILIEEKTENE
ncbi:hypothetical protein [Pedobacter agri]|uniref:Uncharacterized protein n=1 Tax=Pedobacter agri TaxID=454586 RepID=A0A9X3IAT0_9SPHI|nr:hypothetical protein [Pedobacter agri]MCX3267237.1 hypothetical protein [Pedobacter agri]